MVKFVGASVWLLVVAPPHLHPYSTPVARWTTGPDDDWVVSGDDVAAVGTLFLDSLLTLKHLGAQSQTAEALESVCKRLLAHGSKHLALAALPRAWMSDLLLKFDNADSLRLVSGWVMHLARATFTNPAASIECSSLGCGPCVYVRTCGPFVV
jgi:hypothetical protein